MKATAQRLAEVYCRPTTEGEWDLFGLINLKGHQVMVLAGEPTLVKGDFPNSTEIPVQHFQDLRNDSIVSWRLVEDGFEYHEYGYVSIKVKHAWVTIDTISDMTVHVEDSENASIMFAGVKTYTQLLTLIELIG